MAENFGRLRSLFAQFWSTFAVVRSLNWLVRKLLVMLGIRTEDEFKVRYFSYILNINNCSYFCKCIMHYNREYAYELKKNEIFFL